MKKSVLVPVAVLLVAGMGLIGCSEPGKSGSTVKPVAAGASERPTPGASQQSTPAPVGPPPQSHADACQLAEAGLAVYSQLQTEAMSSLGDRAKAQAMLTTMQDTFITMDAKVTQPAVKAKTAAASVAVSGFVDYVSGVLADPVRADTSQVGPKMSAVTDATSEISTECAAS